MKRHILACMLTATMACGALPLWGCSNNAMSAESGQTDQATEATAATTALANGTYSVDVTTDSSMFRSDSCTLTVTDGTYAAELVLPGEGFSKLYFGTAEDAAAAPADAVYEYRLNDEGKYTFDIPVAALDEDLQIAAYGQRRDKWYDHTIRFASPAEETADAS